LPLRLEPIDAQHPETVALVRGPLVLFAMTADPPSLPRQQLLNAVQLPRQTVWRIDTATGPLLFRPFTAIADQTYSTYVKIA